MKARARQPFGTAPVSGARIEERCDTAVATTLHVHGRDGQLVEVVDLSPRGCRVSATTDLAVASHVSLMLAGATLISGRVAWNDGTALGIDFCMPLLRRVVARLTPAG